MLYQLSYEAQPIGSEVNLPMKALTLKRAIQGHIYMKYSGIPIFRTTKTKTRIVREIGGKISETEKWETAWFELSVGRFEKE